MSTNIEARWSALTISPDKPVFQLLDPEHPLSLYVGKSMDGEYLFLLVDGEQPPDLKGTRSLGISKSVRFDGRWNLLLTLRKPELSGVFALLCEDIAESTRGLPKGSTGIHHVVRRIRAWRKLMESGDSDLLSENAIRGLMGELVLLEQLLLSGRDLGLVAKAWVGPLKADQDFQFDDIAWEVKTTNPDVESVLIASERQLYSTERRVRLVVMTLVESIGSEATSLNEQVLKIRKILFSRMDALDRFEDMLCTAGYMTRNAYDRPRLKVGRVFAYDVGAGFPRLSSETVPVGVYDVSYRIELDACAAQCIGTNLKDIAAETIYGP
jgi:hypothetical protein